MKRFAALSLILIFCFNIAFGAIKPTKNIIVLIPDGTSLSVMSGARWLQAYRTGNRKLNIDPYICGTVTTFSSNAPIGDSAPTTSCYMTGMPQQAGNVAIYPQQDKGNDLFPINPDSAYQPLVTLLEAMKLEQQKSTGLVVTCEFTHATPADCSAHTYNRGDYSTIAQQMVHNNLDVVFGGGNAYLNNTQKEYLERTNTSLIQNDKDQFLSFNGTKLWALFGKKDTPYDIDRDTTLYPSLEQMTSKAIQTLRKNKNGFFLMVEGSKIDWAAHANDPIAMMTEFIAFDRAVGVALDFARKEGNTTVIVMPDHGNSGFSIGRSSMKKSYVNMTLSDLFSVVSQYKHSAEGLQKILMSTPTDKLRDVFKENTGINLTDTEVNQLVVSTSVDSEGYMEVSYTENLAHVITKIMNDRSTFGFTSGGHTGEEVFLANYNPNGQTLGGNVLNTDLHKYLYQVSGLKKTLSQITSELYCQHTQVFKGLDFKIEKVASASPKLIVKSGENELVVLANTSEAYLNGKRINIGSVAVYIDKTNLFYLPKKLSSILVQSK